MGIVRKYEPKRFVFPKRDVCKWNIRATMTMLYGLPGCGKTTEVTKLSERLNVLIIDFDKGGAIGRVGTVVTIENTEHLLDVLHSIKKGQFDVVIIDSVDLMEEMIDSTVRDEFAIAFTGQVQYGKDWIYGRAMTIDVFNLLSSINSHVLIVGHAIEKEIKDDRGSIYKQIAPAMREKIFNSIGGKCVATLYMKAVGADRYIFSKQMRDFYAKDRTKKFPHSKKIPLDSMEFCNIYLDAFGVNSKKESLNEIKI